MESLGQTRQQAAQLCPHLCSACDPLRNLPQFLTERDILPCFWHPGFSCSSSSFREELALCRPRPALVGPPCCPLSPRLPPILAARSAGRSKPARWVEQSPPWLAQATIPAYFYSQKSVLYLIQLGGKERSSLLTSAVS